MSANAEKIPPVSRRHFSFEDIVLEREVAHGGSQPILAKRILTLADLGANHVDMVIVPAGADIGIHTHDLSNQELYIIISGEGMMLVEGAEVRVASGHVIVNRPGGTHALRNLGIEEIRIVVVEVPEPGYSQATEGR